MTTSNPKDLRIADYSYQLPEDKIAAFPLPERDASKLLIYDNGKISEDIFSNVAAYIPPQSLVVFNMTKVVHARLIFQKRTGGIVEIFCLEPHKQYADLQKAMQQQGHVCWECMIGGAKKWKSGEVMELRCFYPAFILRASVLAKHRNGTYSILLEWTNEQLTFAEVLHHAGKVPLPPYINRLPAAEDEDRYQTIFAKDEGSVAAPTASLHFTDHVLQQLDEKDIKRAFVTLHVGAGTFKPVKSETMLEHDMHPEWITVSTDTIEQLLQHGCKNIIAAGTTSLRTLESLYWIGNKLAQRILPSFEGIAVTQWEPYETPAVCTPLEALSALKDFLFKTKANSITTRTQILITPVYDFKIADTLITNFHQPQSTLLLLVAAFTGNDWRRIYEYALQHQFRFLSYGDSSILKLRKNG